MKTFQTLAVMALVLGLVEISLGGWETSGDNIYTVKGNVGIGTTSPGTKLDIVGDIQLSGGFYEGTPENRLCITRGAYVDIYTDGYDVIEFSPNYKKLKDLTYNHFHIYRQEDKVGLYMTGNEYVMGSVGIGTSSPDAKLTLYDGGPANYLFNVGGSGNGKMKVRHIDGKDWQSSDVDSLYLQYGMNKNTIINAGGSTGNVGIGTESPQAKLDVVGTTATDVLVIRGGADLAEPFSISNAGRIAEGSLVVIDDKNPGHLKMSDSPYDKKVAGVVSGAGGLNPGLTLTQKGIVENGVKVALTGRVFALADASNGGIEPGDLLTTSAVPGHAMKATDRDRSYGAVIGKAMSPLKKGQGLVLVLVSLQ